MVDSLKDRVEQLVDATIRSFNPRDPASYEHWSVELERAEQSLEDSAAFPERQGLLASVLCARIDLAFDVGNIDFVLEHSARFLRVFRPGQPSFFTVATSRARALHIAGSHDQELREVMELVREPAIRGSEYVFLLENLCRRHPGSLPAEAHLVAKMKETLREFDGLSLAAADDRGLEVTVLEVAAALRQANLAQARAVLANDT